MDGRVDLPRIAEVIRRESPDLVALQEVDRGVERSGGIDEPAELGRLTGMQSIFEKNIPYQGGEYGNAVLTKLPVIGYRNHHLPRSLPGEQRGILEVTVRGAQRPLHFYATHFDYHADDGERMASVRVFRELAARHIDQPVILAGDLNARPESQVLGELLTFMQDSFIAPARLAATGPASPDPEQETNAASPGTTQMEQVFTYPADRPDRRIDYILFNRAGGLTCVEYRIVNEPTASDHRPIVAVLRLSKSSGDGS